ncbi:tape measure protein [Microbacterium phage Nicole72]|uniref:Tape measure protein n=1 Tax=Microbacterium phage Nicole72 TaxID=3062838 RepID=A0ACD4UHR7_9CAUD|nr:tape measure protein [Microbacterium phage Nicole72]
MAGNTVGSVSVTVEADADDFSSDVESQTAKGMKGVGENLGRLINEGLRQGLQGSLASVAQAAGNTLQSGLGRVGQAVGATLSKALGPNLSASLGGFLSQLTTAQGRMQAFGSLGESIGTRLQSALGPKLSGGLLNLVAGFKSSQAAASSFTGSLGTIGGLARGAFNVAQTAVSGFASAAKSALSGIVSVASSVWEKVKSGASTAFRAIGDSLNSALSSAAKITGTAVAATLGTAMAKGFSRLEAIDTATAKLTGLGHSTESVASIMQSATAAVKGTAYGLGDAASAAAQFAAAGVPLDGMQRSLTILASASSVAGADMNEMTTIFGKVAATGKLNGEVVQQLAERGIPVLSLLAKQYGVTGEEAQKMVSEGKVGFEEFQTVLEGSLGPAAAAMGQSFSGMLKNVGAALGRLGAAFQAPAFEAAKGLFPPIMAAIDQLTSVVGPLATALGERLAPAIDILKNALGSFDLSGFAANLTATDGAANGFLNALAPLSPLLLGIAGAMGPLLGSLPVIGPLFAGITAPVGLLVGALGALLVFKPDTLISGFESIASAVPGMIDGLVGAISTLIPEMVNRIATNLPIFVNGILNVLTAAVPAIIGAIPTLVAAFAQMIPQVITTLMAAIPQLIMGALTLFQGIVQAVVLVIPQIVTSLVTMIPQLATALLSALPQIITAALQLFMGIVQGVIEAVPAIISAVLELLPVLLETVVGMIPDLINAALELFLGIILGLAEAIPSIIAALLDLLPQLISTLIGMIPTLIQGAVTLFTGIVEALPRVIPQIISALIGLAPVMVDALIQLVPQLIQAGVDLISGLVNGLLSAAGQVGETLLNIAKNAVGDFLSFLGINSPSRLMYGAGQDTMQGYINAVDDMADDASKSMLRALTPPPAPALVPNAEALGRVGQDAAVAIANRQATAGTSAPGIPGVPQDIDINVIGDLHPERTARAVADTLAEKVAVVAA